MEQAKAPRWIEGEAFEEFWASVWKSETGRAWARSEDPQARWLKERLASRPFFVCQPWEPELQRRHFSQMWGQVFERAYKNPALEDLYWIHELTHWATADLKPAADFQAWRAKWDLNELRASCASEILAHGPMPHILSEAMGATPWAARFGELGGENGGVPRGGDHHPVHRDPLLPGSRPVEQRDPDAAGRSLADGAQDARIAERLGIAAPLEIEPVLADAQRHIDGKDK